MWERSQYDQVLTALATESPALLGARLRAAHAELSTPLFIREFAALLGIEIAIRSPYYLLHPNPMVSEYRRVLAILVLECAALGVPIRIVSAGQSKELVRDPRRTITLTFHTHGESPNHWHLKDSHAPHRFYFNKLGYSGWLTLSPKQSAGVIDGTLERPGLAEDWLNALRAAPVTKYAQPDSSDAVRPGGVFFPLQLLGDTVSALHRVPLLDALTIAAETVPATGRRLTVKRHPMCRDVQVTETLDRLRGVSGVDIVNCDVREAVAVCDVVMTANSSVGFTALIAGKPVIAFGDSDYDVCTYKAADCETLRALLMRMDLKLDEEVLRRYVELFLLELTFDIRDEAPLRKRLVGAVAELISNLTESEFAEAVRAAPRF